MTLNICPVGDILLGLAILNLVLSLADARSGHCLLCVTFDEILKYPSSALFLSVSVASSLTLMQFYTIISVCVCGHSASARGVVTCISEHSDWSVAIL